MIYTLTLNPAVDYYMEMSGEMNREGVIRGRNEQYRAAGKGLNVSRDLSIMQIPSVAVALLGGFTGEFIRQAFSGDPLITLVPIPVKGNNRVNVKLVKDGTLIAVNGAGPKTDDSIESDIMRAFENVGQRDTVVISGSVMPGINPEMIIYLCAKIHNHGGEVVLDTERLSPEAITACRPQLIKRTLQELAQQTGRKQEDPEDAVSLLKEAGFPEVLLPLDDEKVYLKSGDQIYLLRQPEHVHVNPVGRTDALLAAYIGKRTEGLMPQDALRWAGAMANAVASTLDDTSLDEVMRLFDEIKTELI